MNKLLKTPNKILSSPRCYSTSLNTNNSFSYIRTHMPSVVISPLKLSSARSCYVPHSFVNNNNIFRNYLQVRLSPLKHTIIKKYNIKQTNFPQRCRVYPSINKCNSKRCGCCNFLSHRSTITSTVNGRTFNSILNADID